MPLIIDVPPTAIVAFPVSVCLVAKLPPSPLLGKPRSGELADLPQLLSCSSDMSSGTHGSLWGGKGGDPIGSLSMGNHDEAG